MGVGVDAAYIRHCELSPSLKKGPLLLQKDAARDAGPSVVKMMTPKPVMPRGKLLRYLVQEAGQLCEMLEKAFGDNITRYVKP